MRLIAGIVIAGIVAFVFGSSIKRFARLYYAVAVILDILFLICTSVTVPTWLRVYILFMFQSNTLAMGFFIIVMYTGVLSEKLSIKKFLVSIRAELSIIASILCVGHVVVYGASYFQQLIEAALHMPAVRLWATIVALLLVLLLIPLAITSFKAIRARMAPQAWKRLQKLAYLFFALIFVHILFYLLPPAMAGGLGPQVSVVVYTAIGLAYLALRLRLKLRHRQLAAKPG